jgi:cephalosporin hydroxylase
MTNHTIQEDYRRDIERRLIKSTSDETLKAVRVDLLNQMNWHKYAYNFTWFGSPVIQIPQDTMTFQELIWKVQPDLIIETGIAHGGSLIFSASMLALLETFGLVKAPIVVGLDIEIRKHNKYIIESHPAAKWIHMIEGSSTDLKVISQVQNIASNKKRVMVFLDSNHTHDHVLKELMAYAPLVTIGSYCIILDTGIEEIDPSAIAPNREWGKGNSPKSALNEFLLNNDSFILDDFYHEKAWVTSAPGGFIKKIKN